MVTTLSISVATVVHGNIQSRILQWFLLHRGCWVYPAPSSQKFHRPLLKKLILEVHLLRPGWRLADGRLAQMDWGEVFPFTDQVRKPTTITQFSRPVNAVDQVWLSKSRPPRGKASTTNDTPISIHILSNILLIIVTLNDNNINQ